MVRRSSSWGMRWTLAIFVAISSPCTCFANLGGIVLFKATGFQHAAVTHFLSGNLLLGVVEAWVLTWWFQARSQRSYRLMILANYASAMVYFPYSSVSGAPFRPANLPTALLSAFAVTLLLEAPFVSRCFDSDYRAGKRWFAAHVVAQVISYGLMLGYYEFHPFHFEEIEYTIPISPRIKDPLRL